MTVLPAQGGTATRPVVLFVLGMGRSGTSALTRVLSLCGATLPTGMMGADAGNPRGYWEPRAALRLNEKFLGRRGSTYFDPGTEPLIGLAMVPLPGRTIYLRLITGLFRPVNHAEARAGDAALP